MRIKLRPVYRGDLCLQCFSSSFTKLSGFNTHTKSTRLLSKVIFSGNRFYATMYWYVKTTGAQLSLFSTLPVSYRNVPVSMRSSRVFKLMFSGLIRVSKLEVRPKSTFWRTTEVLTNQHSLNFEI